MAFELECDGYGSIPAKIMFVGISAGRRGALITKVPLTKDASGRIFQRCLKELNLSDSDEFSVAPILKNCYITNLVKGRCLTKNGLNRLPTIKEREFWLPYFLEECKKVNPQIVIALGEFVWKGLRHFLPCLVLVKHPRWYQAHGALDPKSFAFNLMVLDYRKAISVSNRSKTK